MVFLIVVLMVQFRLYLHLDFLLGLLDFVLNSLLLIELLFSLQHVQSIFLADVPLLRKQLYVLQLKIKVAVFNLVQLHIAKF